LHLLDTLQLIGWVNLARNVNIDHASVKGPVISIAFIPNSHSSTSAPPCLILSPLLFKYRHPAVTQRVLNRLKEVVSHKDAAVPDTQIDTATELLSKRETEAFSLIVEGCTNKEIGDRAVYQREYGA
jgi:biotin synthase-related radical SAM superfamily protein